MSKELEALREIKEIYELAIKAVNDNNNEKLTNCEVKRFELIEKSLKALEIIKEKRVNIPALLECEELSWYNAEFCGNIQQLTQEEYDLLKEVLL